MRKESGIFAGWRMTAVLWTVYFLITAATSYNSGVTSAYFVTQYGWSESISGMVASVGSAALVLVSVPVGRLISRKGCKASMTVGALISTVAYLLALVLPMSPALYIIVYMLAYVGLMTAALSPVPAAVNKWFELRLSGPLAIVTTAGAVAGFLMPGITERVIYSAGDRYCWLISAGLSLLALFINLLFFRETPESIGEVKDGRLWRTSHGFPTETERASQPETGWKNKWNLRVFHSWDYVMITFQFFVDRAVMLAFMSYVVLNAIQKGISPEMAAGIIVAMNLSSFFARLLSMYIDRIPVSLKGQNTLSYLIMAVGYLLYAAADNIWFYLASGILMGLSTGYLAVLVPMMYARSYPGEDFSAMYAVAQMVGYIGSITMPVATFALSAALGSMRNANLAITAFAFLCFASTFTLQRTAGRKRGSVVLQKS